MADILIVCVRDDESQAKALADMFERAGFSVGGAPNNDAALRSSGAAVVVWSQASIRSRPFLDASQRVVNAGKAVLACLIAPPPPASVKDSPSFDLTDWAGDPDDPLLDPLFFAVDRKINAGRAKTAPQAAATAGYDAPSFGGAAYDAPPPAASGRSARSQPAPPPAYARGQRPTPASPPASPPGFQMRTPPARSAAPPADPAPRPSARNAPPSRSALTTPPYDAVSDEAAHWRAIRNSNDPEVFLDYLNKHGPDGTFSELAQLRLRQLESSSVPAPPARQSRPPAEIDPFQHQPPAVERRPARAETFDPDAFTFDDAPQPRREARSEARPRRQSPPDRTFERSYEDVTPIDPPKSGGGGFFRMFLLLVLLGGAGVAGAIYMGYGDRLIALVSGADDPAWVDDPPISDLRGAEIDAGARSSNEPADAEGLSATPLAQVVDPSPTVTARTAERTAQRTQERTPPPRAGAPSGAQSDQVDPALNAAATPQPFRPVSPSGGNAAGADYDTRARGPLSLTPGAGDGPADLSSAAESGDAPYSGFSYPNAASSSSASQGVSLSPSTPEPLVATPAPPPAGTVIWTSRPAARSVERFYPRQALRDSVGGNVTLDCRVRNDLGLSCVVASETPSGVGFGRAALQVVGDYRARATLSNGAASAGASTRMTINFRPPEN